MRNHLISLTAAFILFSTQLYPQISWEVIKTPVDVNLTKVVYLDSLHLWAAGDSGTIIFSSDQGASWQIQNNQLENAINDLFFLNQSLGWALTWYVDGINLQSQILFTGDGGNNWERWNYPNTNFVLQTIFFLDSLTGWTGGIPYEFSSTIDGGLNWSPVELDTSALSYLPVQQIRFSNPQYGFAVGGSIDYAGSVWFTNNGGNSWKGYIVAPDIFNDFIFLDSINIISPSADIEGLYPIGIIKFDLQQNFWTYSEIDKYGRVSSISKRTPNEIWGTITTSYNFIVSTDTGSRWEFFPTPDSLIAHDIAFLDSLKGFAVGEKGHVFKFKPSPPSSIKNDFDISQPYEFVLYQNYPNPFNPTTTIKYTLRLPDSPLFGGARDKYVTLQIYDILGNEVSTLVDEYKPAGSYEVEFSAKVGQASSIKLQGSGIYFYQLKVTSDAGGFIQTKKMLLLR